METQKQLTLEIIKNAARKAEQMAQPYHVVSNSENNFWNPHISRTGTQKLQTPSEIPMCIYMVRQSKIAVQCLVCNKKIRSFNHICIVNRTKRRFLNKTNLQNEKSETLKQLLPQSSVYRMCNFGQYNITSKQCLVHLPLNVEFFIHKYILYEKIPTPENFNLTTYTTQHLIRPIYLTEDHCVHLPKELRKT